VAISDDAGRPADHEVLEEPSDAQLASAVSASAANTFVSSHYTLGPHEVVQYLQRKNVKYAMSGATAETLTIEECPFCVKPTHRKRDNLHKLYVWCVARS
jgi:hypothetical protein